MAARIIDGSAIAKELQQKIKADVAKFKEQNKTPGLAIVLVNSPVARTNIAELKKRMCDSVGIYCEVHTLNSLSGQANVMALVEKLNADPKITGINIHPMPNHIDYRAVVHAIDPLKDVEGVHPENMGNFLIGDKRYIPFTPRGIMKLLESTGIELKGKRAVIVGRSQHVGLPVGFLLLERHATVSFAHSRSWYLEQLTCQADVLVVAAGHAEMITGSMVKPGAVVIDVGTNLVGGHLVGDVEHDSVSQVAGWLTPVPGGVGPMTVAMLLNNLIGCCD
ncbi:MAG: bifunctional 5,10-methylenetetrahydrofolate dehydrogenase/5,10-methenyltetrahydrofolate cyclohydrolase [Dethiobacter sp.]|jgi:methylenetetrahydrofolate dehydrogenase (NADP+)/methenyltetrahydrofolate cyclohydrolase|nr:bifunctional 5,10-methylenetetrahydrofolate dehydrogenase/5,10-methenyltetrahydrofolate cyclohydrolase [Dethiobacter sp.]MBS3901952.1 bifunctional 5,10-methylenetetrahydrofolate dehydrogenase/5,10-methenyltetrahydrofolate cyclohydrolase [Dethiobacter sp.]MBS3988769.1 bifunctional 5,10-methylenetetrahydrofolate dehydrogenase/5,10-methenyltetrahydrofolate cyclohydrolase [Dethiobacter sp.]